MPVTPGIVFTINTAPFRSFIRGLQDGPQLLREEMISAVTEVAAYAERQTVLGEPEDEGGLKRDTTSWVDQQGSLITGFVGVEGQAASYAWPVELGTRPHWAPVDAIEGWVQRKGIQFSDSRGRPMSIKQIAFIINRSMSVKGTDGYHMAKNAFEAGNTVMNDIIDRHLEEFRKKLQSRMGG